MKKFFKRWLSLYRKPGLGGLYAQAPLSDQLSLKTEWYELLDHTNKAFRAVVALVTWVVVLVITLGLLAFIAYWVLIHVPVVFPLMTAWRTRNETGSGEADSSAPQMPSPPSEQPAEQESRLEADD